MGDNDAFGIIDFFDKDKDYSDFETIDFKQCLEKFSCVLVADDIVNMWIIPSTYYMKTYLRKFGNEFKGIDHYGVTLLPPESLEAFLKIVKPYVLWHDKKESEKVSILIELINKAIRENKHMICFGI
ncbi:MAG: hypothetical protein IJN12_02830 [Clostridia bacterium]|nr:hypothetical protein [Clostridia bacterium]